eukprot:416530-Pleurochrysis_carterae.AAC.1
MPRSDVVAVHDGPGCKMLNIGLIWIRSTNATIAMSTRAANRTEGGWDQYIFNEELNFNPDFSSVSCCHTYCLLKSVDRRADAAVKTVRGGITRQAVEGKDKCSDREGFTLEPPRDSRFYNSMRPWKQQSYNQALKQNHRKFGRCTHMGQTCGGTNASCAPEPMRSRA